MSSLYQQSQLQRLRPGDRLKYRGIEWRITDYSTYNDPNGYEMEEWLLKAGTGKKYYLLREIDPQNRDSLLNWYLAEEVNNPRIYLPDYGQDISSSLWRVMQDGETPYPELQVFGRSYHFESQTQGSYEEDNKLTERITWDYWDKPHQWNLALEAWPNYQLRVYSTQVVKPGEFSQIVKSSRNLLWLRWFRVSLATGGIILLLVGCAMFIYG